MAGRFGMCGFVVWVWGLVLEGRGGAGVLGWGGGGGFYIKIVLT